MDDDEVSQWAKQASAEDKALALARLIDTTPHYKAWSERCIGLPVGGIGGKPIYLDFEGHSLNIGQSGEGKFSSIIAPMLLHDVCDGRGVSAGFVVIDPKNGEAARVTAPYRRLQREEHVFVIDPYGQAGGTDALNPFDFLNPKASDFNESCAGLANALIVQRPVDKRSSDFFWDSIGAMWLTAMIAHLVLSPGEERSIRRLRAVFCETREGLIDVLLAMEENPASPSWVVNAARNMKRVFTEAEKEASGYLATIYEATKFADSALMGRVLERSTFDPIAVRTHGATIYVVAKDDYLPQAAPWLRVVCETIRQRINRSPVQRHVHWVLDEAKAFEAWTFIDQGLRAMRGFDMSLHLFYQNIGQIRGVWGDAWTAITDARLIRFLGSNDVETLKWIAELCGEVRVVDYSRGANSSDSTSQADARGESSSQARAEGTTSGRSLTTTTGRSTGATQSKADARGESLSLQNGVADGETWSEGAGWSRGDSYTFSDSESSQSSSSHSWSDGSSDSMSFGPGGWTNSFGWQRSSSGSSSESSSLSFGHAWGSQDSRSGNSSRGGSRTHNVSSTTGTSQTQTSTSGRSQTESNSRATGENSGASRTNTQTEGRSLTHTNTRGASHGHNETLAERRRLMTVDEVRRLPPHAALLFVNREPDCLVERVHYFNAPPLLLRVFAGMAAFPPPEPDDEDWEF